MSLTKSGIVERIYKEAGFSKKEATDLVELVFKIMKETLSRGEKIKISGFGNFLIRDKNSRMGRNPQTGDRMEISARRVLTFRPSEVLKEDITSRYIHRLDNEGKENTSLEPKEGESRALGLFMAGSEEQEQQERSQNSWEDDPWRE